MKQLSFACMLMTAILFSCSPGKKMAATAEALKAKWVLQSLTGQPDLGPLFGSRLPFIQFDTDNSKISGNGGCNNLNGAYKLENGRQLSIDNLAMTRMACPGNGEAHFTDALRQVTHFSIKNDVLTLLKGDETLMTLHKEGQ